MEEKVSKEDIKKAISVMKKAYNVYNDNARKNIERDEANYWHWKGLAEGTRRSWELLEEMLNINDN